MAEFGGGRRALIVMNGHSRVGVVVVAGYYSLVRSDVKAAKLSACLLFPLARGNGWYDMCI